MAQAGISANRLELLQIADAVAREKSIGREACAFGDGGCDPEGGQVALWQRERDPRRDRPAHRRDQAVAAAGGRGEGDARRHEIALKDAKKRNPEAEVGDFIAEPLPPLDFGRVAAQNAKQVIVQKVREAERERQFEEYKDRIGEIVSGVVKRAEYGNVMIDLGRAEGDRAPRRDASARALQARRPRPRLCLRRAPQNRARRFSYPAPGRSSWPKLFAQEVPEIYDGIVEIKSVARDPGSRAKIAVFSKDSSIDPVGACVGMRGSRVQAVVGELQGEKIDIIPWSPDSPTFVVQRAGPRRGRQGRARRGLERMEVVVPDEQLSPRHRPQGPERPAGLEAHGLGHRYSDRNEESSVARKSLPSGPRRSLNALDVDEMIAQLLVAEGFTSVEELAFVEAHEVASIEGFDETTAVEIQERAREFLEAGGRA